MLFPRNTSIINDDLKNKFTKIYTESNDDYKFSSNIQGMVLVSSGLLF